MSVHLFSRVISSWFVFALPLFRSFQALQHRPASEPDVEHYAKYWIVIGVLMAFENTLEFIVSWFPFYWELKLFFLLFLSLPQTKGSTYVYDTWLAPFLSRNELYIDRQVQLAEANFLGFFQSQVQTILDKVMGMRKAYPAKSDPTVNQGGSARTSSSIQNAISLAMGYLTAHGVSIAGKDKGSRPADLRTPSGTSPSAPFLSASSTSVQSPFTNEASHRSGFASENHVSPLITPDDIYQASASG